jgi:ATP-dependent exoDNAse (exonuclease V) alpha subunit
MTVHSALGFHSYESLKANRAGVVNAFIRLAYKAKALVIDEISMFSAEMLDELFGCYVEALETIERIRGRASDFGLIVTGDFVQLPPVQGKFAFKAKCWPYFAENAEVLKKIYRQQDPAFAAIMQAARAGKGVSTAQALVKAGVKFVNEPLLGFPGTTLYPINTSVEKHNRESYALLDGEERTFPSFRWGTQINDWKMIPDSLTLKVGAQVMALVNVRSKDGDAPNVFSYANGSVGTVTGIDENSDDNDTFIVETSRPTFICKFPKTNFEGPVEYAQRKALVKTPPFGVKQAIWKGPDRPEKKQLPADADLIERAELAYAWGKFLSAYAEYERKARAQGEAYYDFEEKLWVIGTIEYIPLQLAYALSFHKAQGLTLDSVQIDARNRMAGNPGMMYVALSRATGPERLVIAGNPTIVAKHILTHPDVKVWV